MIKNKIHYDYSMDTKETFEKIQYQFIIITFNDEEEKGRALTFKGNPHQTINILYRKQMF